MFPVTYIIASMKPNVKAFLPYVLFTLPVIAFLYVTLISLFKKITTHKQTNCFTLK